MAFELNPKRTTPERQLESKPEKQHLLFNWNRLPEFVRFFRLGFVLLL